MWLIVELPAGNDMRLGPGPSQVEGEVTDNLTRRGMVGEEEAIEEDNAFHSKGRQPATGAGNPGWSSRYRIITRHTAFASRGFSRRTYH